LDYFLFDFLNLHVLNTVSLNELLNVEKKFHDILQTYWLENTYLTPRWWFLVILSVVSPLIWWKLVNKKRILEITAFGLFYGTAAIILDSIGSNALVWSYPVLLTPYIYPQLYPYDVGIVIISFMLVFQRWGKHFKTFFLFTGLLSAFLAFMAEPFMEWLKIYKELTWKNIYSFPIYWLLSIICWSIIKYFNKLEQK
jgi:hypothetical protein